MQYTLPHILHLESNVFPSCQIYAMVLLNIDIPCVEQGDILNKKIGVCFILFCKKGKYIFQVFIYSADYRRHLCYAKSPRVRLADYFLCLLL